MSDTGSIAQLLNPTLIKAKVPAANWRQAVICSGELMEANGICTADYTKAMQQTVVDYGAYVVITPGVAMPHARPESGVLKPGISLLTLAQPVEFGHKENDPVDLVIAFAAVDKNAHIDTLRKIIGLLGDEDKLEALRAATTDEELWAALNS